MTTPDPGSPPSSPAPGGRLPPPGQWAAPPGGQYPPPQPTYYAPSQATNGMAIASMVLGIVWIYWIGSILALVFGYIAKSQIAQRHEAGGGMATAGIVLGWIGVGTFVLFFILPLLGLAIFGDG